MGGVGFGGYVSHSIGRIPLLSRLSLVTLLIGHLRMNLNDAVDTLLEVASAVFPEVPQRTVDRDTNTNKLRKAVEDVLEARNIPLDTKMNDPQGPPSKCKVYVFPLSHIFPLFNHLQYFICRNIVYNQSSSSIPYLSLTRLESQPNDCRSDLCHYGRTISLLAGENWTASEAAGFHRRCHRCEQSDSRIA
jgi:hypothetical protein